MISKLALCSFVLMLIPPTVNARQGDDNKPLSGTKVVEWDFTNVEATNYQRLDIGGKTFWAFNNIDPQKAGWEDCKCISLEEDPPTGIKGNKSIPKPSSIRPIRLTAQHVDGMGLKFDGTRFLAITNVEKFEDLFPKSPAENTGGRVEIIFTPAKDGRLTRYPLICLGTNWHKAQGGLIVGLKRFDENEDEIKSDNYLVGLAGAGKHGTDYMPRPIPRRDFQGEDFDLKIEWFYEKDGSTGDDTSHRRRLTYYLNDFQKLPDPKGPDPTGYLRHMLVQPEFPAFDINASENYWTVGRVLQGSSSGWERRYYGQIKSIKIFLLTL